MNTMTNIKAQTKTALDAVLTNVPVSTARIRPTDLRNLPAVFIYNESVSISNELPNNLGIAGPMTAVIAIDVATNYSGDFAAAQDVLINQVIDGISSQSYLDSAWTEVSNVSIDYQYIDDFEKPLAIATIKITGTVFKEQ